MNEFDYSGLYHTQPGQQPQQPASDQPAYPNVGSSGLNTANTARTDFSEPQQPQGDAGYSSSFGGGTGGYTGYSYTSAPQQPPRKPKKNFKKAGMRILAGLCCLALGVGGGFGGAALYSRINGTGQMVVTQNSRRDAEGEPLAQGSTGGNDLTFQEVAAIVQPSVVVITTEQMVSANTWFGGSYVQSGAGSGVVMSSDGYILTCAHVVSGATNVKVQLNDGEEYTATVVGSDSNTDIAVLKIEADGLTPAVMGDSDTLVVGENAVAVGNPMGTLGGTVTNGIVSALNREVTVQNNQMTLIQTNAAISPGNSGGGLFNGRGELIGIVNAKTQASANGVATNAEGLGFAIPVNTALSVAQDLINNGYVKRPVLGISVVTISSAEMAMQYGVSNLGVYISQVNAGSGAQAAGLKAGDRILAIGDTAVTESTDVTGYLKDFAVGDVVTLQIAREDKLITVDVTLGESQG